MNKKILILTFLLISLTSFSHPHVFVDINTTVNTENDNITSISFEWTYDELFSGAIISDYDKNNDNIFSKDEESKLKESIFKNMKDYDYYTFFYINNQRVKLIPEFQAKIHENQLVFTFLFAEKIPFSKYVKLLVYDEEYFHSMNWNKLIIKGNSKEKIKKKFSKEEIMLSFFPVEIEILHLGDFDDKK